MGSNNDDPRASIFNVQDSCAASSLHLFSLSTHVDSNQLAMILDTLSSNRAAKSGQEGWSRIRSVAEEEEVSSWLKCSCCRSTFIQKSRGLCSTTFRTTSWETYLGLRSSGEQFLLSMYNPKYSLTMRLILFT